MGFTGIHLFFSTAQRQVGWAAVEKNWCKCPSPAPAALPASFEPPLSLAGGLAAPPQRAWGHWDCRDFSGKIRSTAAAVGQWHFFFFRSHPPRPWVSCGGMGLGLSINWRLGFTGIYRDFTGISVGLGGAGVAVSLHNGKGVGWHPKKSCGCSSPAQACVKGELWESSIWKSHLNPAGFTTGIGGWDWRS